MRTRVSIDGVPHFRSAAHVLTGDDVAEPFYDEIYVELAKYQRCLVEYRRDGLGGLVTAQLLAREKPPSTESDEDMPPVPAEATTAVEPEPAGPSPEVSIDLTSSTADIDAFNAAAHAQPHACGCVVMKLERDDDGRVIRQTIVDPCESATQLARQTGIHQD